MTVADIHLRPAHSTDLDDINAIIESAIMNWNLPQRVKRLSVPVYRYDALDFEHLEIMLALDNQQQIVGITAWEPADSREIPAATSAVLLHGIYVAPHCQHRGIGSQLFNAVEQAARKQDYDGLLVRAQPDASEFFITQGMRRLISADLPSHYAHLFWKNLN